MRVLLADDHPGLLQQVRTLLNPDVNVVGCVYDGAGLVEEALKLRPDVIVTDISMPKLNGIEAVRRLKHAGCSSRVVFLTVHSAPDIVRTALETDAFGYVLKASIATDLLFAIQEATAGRAFISPEASPE